MSEELEGPPPVVDPLIRAHIYSLCTALGGPSIEEKGKYSLGHDALACLKDLRRWLKLYDEKMSRYDVARCLYERKLVQNDLIEIILGWKDEETTNKSRHRLILACVELLAPLTWPIDKRNEQMTVNHHRHIPVLQHAEALYKKAILQHSHGKVLSHIVRVALPSMAIPSYDRTERDEGVMKLVLYVLRNLAMIEHPNPTETDTGVEISRSATISAFANHNVFDLILTISSGIEDEFVAQDVVVLELIYQFIKGVDVEELFRTEAEEAQKKAKDLTSLLRMEDEMKKAGARGSTRHNRFGTTVWMERNDGSRSFVSGQDALLGKETGLQKMDSTKKWKKPRGGDIKGVSAKTELDIRVNLESVAKGHLREFVVNFLDSAFNPLCQKIRRAIERDVERLLTTHTKQFFYLVAWFLKAERVRRTKLKRAALDDDTDSFGLVAAVLNQEMLILLNRKMMEWYDLKSWRDLQAGMQCLTQILYTVQDMGHSPLEDDQEIAENLQNRLFYEETTMDLIVSILRAYTVQPLKWLDDCTEMVHVHLRMLEKYSQQHEHMFVRARRRQNKRKKANAQKNGVDNDTVEENEEVLIAESKRATTERAFDFQKFESKYLNHSCINSFIKFLSYYKELDGSQIMRAIKFLHRIFEKRKMEILLYRLDYVDLFYRMMQGSDSLPKSHPAYKETDQFVRYYLRKLFKKLENEPALYVELLFTKISQTTYYLQYGVEKEARKSNPRAAAELEFKAGLSQTDQLSVAVGALLDDNKSDAVDWLKDVIRKAIEERKGWEAAAQNHNEGNSSESRSDAPFITIKTDSDERQVAMFRDGKLRLLMTILGFEKLDVNETSETKWIIPSTLTSENLQQSFDMLKKNSDDPPVFEDGQLAEDFIRRKLPPRNRYGSESSEDEDENNEYAPGNPTENKPLYEKEKDKEKKKRKRARVEVDDAQLEERRKKKEQADKEKRARIKSTLYVHDSDDESDAENDAAFFAKERALREAGPKLMEEAPTLEVMKKQDIIEEYDNGPPKKKRKSRKRVVESDGEDEQDEDGTAREDSADVAEDGMDTDSVADASRSSVERQKSPPAHLASSEDDEGVQVQKIAGKGRNPRVSIFDDSDSES